MAFKKWNFQQSKRFTEISNVSFSTSRKVATFLHRCTSHPAIDLITVASEIEDLLGIQMSSPSSHDHTNERI